MFSLSGPCELLFLLSCGECYCFVIGSVCLVCWVFHIVCELFDKTIRNMGVVVI